MGEIMACPYNIDLNTNMKAMISPIFIIFV